MASASISNLNPAVKQALPTISTSFSDRLDTVTGFDLFADLSNADLTQVTRAAIQYKFVRNESLFREGDNVDKVFIVERGCVKLTQISPNGSEVILWLRGAGESIDFPAQQSARIHTCSASAAVEGKALVWDWNLLNGLQGASQIRGNISRILEKRVAELEKRFCEIAAENVPTRVVGALSRILSQLGEHSQKGIEVYLSRRELAQLAGTNLFTVSRLMSKWEAKGYVQSGRRTVLVPFPHRFAEMSAI